MVMRLGCGLAFLFGREKRERPSLPVWPSQETWAEQKEPKRDAAERDSDGDGIIDRQDNCPNTPMGATVDGSGCPDDSDSDGVLDGLDDCPVTPGIAAGYVDIFGCPIDTDYDGIPDYRDHCREGPVGTIVDSVGCPIDSDNDGVFDGLDDCPATETGIEVDERGCIDIAFLYKALTVNIDYLPGSFEVDERTKKRLQPLIRKLKILSDVEIKIIGYTDNVGPAEANQILSQKRANRLRDWFESHGIAHDRMTAVGRGETNFIASNQTAEGRAQNRRIVLIFEK
jgi:OOP family OmpA-OmpF porin